MKQARTGELVGIPVENISDNNRKLNQAKALNLIIASQREMITVSRPIIFFGATQKWKKKFKTDEDREKNPFCKNDNDYNKMIEWLGFLKHCMDAIIIADRTKTFADDFMVVKTDNNTGEKKNELTQNFYDMMDDLESSYEQIYLLMLTNKIVSAGIEEDEELSYKEKETAFINRVVEA